VVLYEGCTRNYEIEYLHLTTVAFIVGSRIVLGGRTESTCCTSKLSPYKQP